MSSNNEHDNVDDYSDNESNESDDENEDQDDDDQEENNEVDERIESSVVNIKDLLVDAENPCKCLKQRKCLFKDFLLNSSLNNINVEDCQKTKSLLNTKCINEDCTSMIYEFCLPVKNNTSIRVPTKCRLCFDTKIKSTDKVFALITEKQE